jgi:hypothetical protein
MMQCQQFLWNYNLTARFPHRRTIVRYEGGHVDTAEADGRSYVVIDESTMADFLLASDPSDAEVMERLITVMMFDTVEERDRKAAEITAAHEARHKKYPRGRYE